MNLGIYLQSLADHAQLKNISEAINNNIGKSLEDASIFYDTIAYNPFNIRCGIFNSTELWSFSGKLISTSLSTTLTSLKVINNIDIYYYYGFEEKISPLSLFFLLKNDIRVIARSNESEQDFKRKTKIDPLFVTDSFEEIIQRIS